MNWGRSMESTIFRGIERAGEFPFILIRKRNFSFMRKRWKKLLLSDIPIHEKIPVYERKADVECLTEQYSPEVRGDESFNHFNYYVNEQKVCRRGAENTCFSRKLFKWSRF